jgi:predicted XRE-type DNA-binding protein
MEPGIDNMDEIWKDIKGYEGVYQVSNLGNIKSINYNHTGVSKNLIGGIITGYHAVNLYGNGYRKFKVHRIVALHFIPNPENKPMINHINNIRTDNRVENLEWCTHQENMDHAVKMNLIKPFTSKGEKSWNSFLTNDIVLKIRQVYSEGKLNQREIAKLFNIKYKHVNKIVRRHIWQHI